MAAVILTVHTAINSIVVIAAISCMAATFVLTNFFFHLKAALFFHSLAVLCGFHFFLYFIRPQNQPMADFQGMDDFRGLFLLTFLLIYTDTMMIIEDTLISRHTVVCRAAQEASAQHP